MALDGCASWRGGALVDLLLTDVVMPGGMTGIEPKLLRHGAMTLGRWLRKPYTALDLARTLRRALEPQASALHREGDGATAQAL